MDRPQLPLMDVHHRMMPELQAKGAAALPALQVHVFSFSVGLDGAPIRCMNSVMPEESRIDVMLQPSGEHADIVVEPVLELVVLDLLTVYGHKHTVADENDLPEFVRMHETPPGRGLSRCYPLAEVVVIIVLVLRIQCSLVGRHLMVLPGGA